MTTLLTSVARALGAALLVALALLLGVAPTATAGALLGSSSASAAAAASSGVFQRLDAGSTGASAYDLRPITVAQLEDQLRRPELQATAGKGSIAVLYPNVSEPVRSAFISMIQGIEERTRVRVRSYAVEPRTDPAELNAQLKKSGTRVVIALGRQGLNLAAGLDREILVLVGGALLLSDAEIVNVNSISLTPDPALLFLRLCTLLPEVRRVMVVYDPKKPNGCCAWRARRRAPRAWTWWPSKRITWARPRSCTAT